MRHNSSIYQFQKKHKRSQKLISVVDFYGFDLIKAHARRNGGWSSRQKQLLRRSAICNYSNNSAKIIHIHRAPL